MPIKRALSNRGNLQGFPLFLTFHYTLLVKSRPLLNSPISMQPKKPFSCNLKLLLAYCMLFLENTPSAIDRLILNGFYPRIHDQHLNPTQALGDYLATDVERDVRQIAAIKDLILFEKFVRLCAGLMPELPWGSGLLYGGSDVQIRSNVRIYPLTKIHDLLASLTSRIAANRHKEAVTCCRGMTIRIKAQPHQAGKSPAKIPFDIRDLQSGIISTDD